jgi:outer membrane receptor protein involved in Fe transport
VVRADLGANGSLWMLGDAGALGGRVGVGLSALSSRPLPFGDFADPFAVLDVSGGLRFGLVELGLDVFNLLDTRYSSLEYSFTSAWDPAAPASRLPMRHSNAGSPRTLFVTLELAL